MRALLRYLLLATMIMGCANLYAQEPTHSNNKILNEHNVTIRSINITGNKKTKPYIIAREVPMDPGKQYSLSYVLQNIPRSRQNLMNTSLFIDVAVDFTNWVNDSLDILVDVKERWYFFPVPYLRPVDRNYNVWIDEYNASLSRIDYGIKVLGYNVTGRNDVLNIWAISGYSRQILLNYVAPNFDKSLKNGLSFDFMYYTNREINYITDTNKQEFYKNPEAFVTSRWRFGVGYSYRTGYIKRHNVRLNYNIQQINDSVAHLNPDYFGDGRKRVVYPELNYQYQDINVNYIPYPLTGYIWEFGFVKRGITKEMNLWEFNMKGNRYLEVFPKFYLALQANGTIKFPFDQPYINRQLLGYSNYIRGQDKYVIDGIAGGTAKAALRREFWSPKIKTGLKSRSYGVIPFKFYARIFGDLGYAYTNKLMDANTLNNRLLYSNGVGIDVLSIYDMNVGIDYGYNQLLKAYKISFQAKLGF